MAQAFEPSSCKARKREDNQAFTLMDQQLIAPALARVARRPAGVGALVAGRWLLLLFLLLGFLFGDRGGRRFALADLFGSLRLPGCIVWVPQRRED
jgi:hypothetical protein